MRAHFAHVSSNCSLRDELLRDNDVVDRNVNQFYEEADKTHDCKTDCGCDGYLLEFSPIWFRAPLNESHRVFGELATGFNEKIDLVHVFGVIVASRSVRCLCKMGLTMEWRMACGSE